MKTILLIPTLSAKFKTSDFIFSLKQGDVFLRLPPSWTVSLLQLAQITFAFFFWGVCGCVFSAIKFSSTSLFSSVQLLSHVRLFVTPWIAARQASLSITNSWSSLIFTSIESVMPSSHLILCRPFLLLPSIPPSIRVFSNESTLHMRWPQVLEFQL